MGKPITESELKLLAGSLNELMWDRGCLAIRRNHDDDYPSDWTEKVFRTDLKGETAKRNKWKVRDFYV